VIGAEQSLLSFLDAPVVVGDPDGSAVYVNPAFESRFDVTSAATRGLPLSELFEGGGREAVLRAVAQVLSHGDSVRFRVRERGVGFAAVASPIVADESRVGVVILLKEEVDGGERLMALHREIADPVDELQGLLDALLEQTGGRRAAQYRAGVEDGLRALARVRKWVDELGATLAGRGGGGGGTWDPAAVLQVVGRRFSDRPDLPTDIQVLVPAQLPTARGDGAKLEALLLRVLQDRLDQEPAPEGLTLAGRTVGRGEGRSVLVSVTEHFGQGGYVASAPQTALLAEVLGGCGGVLHTTSDPALGRVTLMRFPAPEPSPGAA
jgi:hypothetical protein